MGQIKANSHGVTILLSNKDSPKRFKRKSAKKQGLDIELENNHSKFQKN